MDETHTPDAELRAVTLEFAVDEAYHEAVAQYFRTTYHVHVVVYDLQRSQNGWPFARFLGSFVELWPLLLEYTTNDQDEALRLWNAADRVTVSESDVTDDEDLVDRLSYSSAGRRFLDT